MEQTYVDSLAPPYYLSHIGNGLHGRLRVFDGKQYLIGSSHGLSFLPINGLAGKMVAKSIPPAKSCQHWSDTSSGNNEDAAMGTTWKIGLNAEAIVVQSLPAVLR